MVYVVERYLPGLSRTDLVRGLSRLAQAIADEDIDVRYLGSTIVLEDEACYCEFEAPTEAAIAEANRRAGLHFDRIVPALTVNSYERRTPMHVSTTVRAPVRFGGPRLYSALVAFAAALAVGIWATVVFTGGSHSQSISARDRQTVNAITALTPAELRAAYGTGLGDADAQHVQAIVSLTPAELVAAFGTDTQAAAVLASLTASERSHVRSIMLLTPEQLRAAYGTDSVDAQHVRAIVSLTPAELVAAFGTETQAAAVLASLTPTERQHVKSIMALTPAQLRAAFGTGM
jgi:hypothetical protein